MSLADGMEMERICSVDSHDVLKLTSKAEYTCHSISSSVEGCRAVGTKSLTY